MSTMTDRTPAYVTTTIEALRAERAPMGARLDAIDLAIENLRRVWPDVQPVGRAPKWDELVAPKRRSPAVARDGGKAEARRALILTAIRQQPDGLTMASLRAATPRMKSGDRGNALQKLKAAGEIRRAGKVWVTAV